ncbi:MAG: cyclase family protein, partial [Actinomycetota bacterium]|nr:cyclase family protein [Actinomycetota bacterium]
MKGALPLHHALALGVLHGPTELLPVSSSAHTTLVPWLLGWPYEELDGELRKAFEVSLHAGTAAALLIGLRDEVQTAAKGMDRRRAVLIAGSFVPPAIAGLALERPIEQRLGTPTSIAWGLIAGAASLVAADLAAPRHRHRDDTTATDALALGLAQACALVPGVSRNWGDEAKFLASAGMARDASLWAAERGVVAVGADNMAWDAIGVRDPE